MHFPSNVPCSLMQISPLLITLSISDSATLHQHVPLDKGIGDRIPRGQSPAERCSIGHVAGTHQGGFRMDRLPMNRKEYRILILILGSLATLGPFSVDMYLPGFPAIAADLHTDIAHVGLTLTSFFIGISLGQIFYGPFIDRYGRKKPLVGGLILFIVAALGCSLAPSIQWLVGTRFFLAVGGCVGMVAGRAVIRDLFPVDRMAQVFSLMMMLGGVAPIIAPVIGGIVVATFGWRFLFYGHCRSHPRRHPAVSSRKQRPGCVRFTAPLACRCGISQGL
jgi:multidrug resistance protein